MKLPCIIVCDRGRELVDPLRRELPDPPWLLRHVLDLEACRKLLADGSPAVLVMGAGQDGARCLEMLGWLQKRGSSVRTVLLRDEPHAAAEALAWDLGAAAIMVGDQRRALPAIVDALAARGAGSWR